MKNKIITGTLAVAAIIAGGTAQVYAEQNKPATRSINEIGKMRKNGNINSEKINFRNANLTVEQHNVITKLRKGGDREKIQEKLSEFGIERKDKGNAKFKELTQEQRIELKELRESGDKDALMKKLSELGINRNRAHLTQEQKDELKELREDGNMDLVREKLKEFGIDIRKGLEHRDEIKGIIDDDGVDSLKKARELFKEGSKEEAKEIIKNIYNENREELNGTGIRGVFHRVSGFFRGLFR